VIGILRTLLGRNGAQAEAGPRTAGDAEPPALISLAGWPAFQISDHVTEHMGMPVVDWGAVAAWLDTIESPDDRARAWAECERAWLLHMRAALGAGFRLAEGKTSMLLSSLEPNLAKAALDHMDRTLRRIELVLEGIAGIAPWGKDVMIVFDDQESYYAYVSRYYPEAGEYALSSGMYIRAGCAHFVTVRDDLRAVEPVVVHEMTHGCVGHLPLPLWLNEGLAVNMERRLAGAGPALFTPQEMHARHLAFWGPVEIQQFWSGQSFQRPDDGNMLSYDLARIIVEQMAKDWARFKKVVLAADRADAGAAAAREHLRVDLGAYVCALLEREHAMGWTPDPTAWSEGVSDRPARGDKRARAATELRVL